MLDHATCMLPRVKSSSFWPQSPHPLPLFLLWVFCARLKANKKRGGIHKVLWSVEGSGHWDIGLNTTMLYIAYSLLFFALLNYFFFLRLNNKFLHPCQPTRKVGDRNYVEWREWLNRTKLHLLLIHLYMHSVSNILLYGTEIFSLRIRNLCSNNLP